MNCQELLRILNDHVDGTLEVAPCTEFEAHLAGCDPCRVVVDNIRQTITIFKDGRPWEMPAEFRAKLRDCLAERWKSEGPPKKV